MRHNPSAREIIETLYRHMRNNYISEFFMYTEESCQPSPMPHVTVPFAPVAPSERRSFRGPSMDSQKELSIRTERLSELDRACLSSDKSLYSFSIGNQSSLYLNSPSQLTGSMRLGSVSRNNKGNAWHVKDQKCFFQPIRNKFYQKYVLQYTKYRTKAKRKPRIRKLKV